MLVFKVPEDSLLCCDDSCFNVELDFVDTGMGVHPTLEGSPIMCESRQYYLFTMLKIPTQVLSKPPRTSAFLFMSLYITHYEWHIEEVFLEWHEIRANSFPEWMVTLCSHVFTSFYKDPLHFSRDHHKDLRLSWHFFFFFVMRRIYVYIFLSG